jgi:hypothetical protein
MSIRDINKIALAALAMSASAFAMLSNTALAAPTLNFSIQTNQFSTPTMEFKFQDGKYVWKQQRHPHAFLRQREYQRQRIALGLGRSMSKRSAVGGTASYFTGKVPHGRNDMDSAGPDYFPDQFSFCVSRELR